MSSESKPEMLMASIRFDSLPGYRMYSNGKNLPVDDLEPLARINIFIGENNSGKSRFLRWLAQTKLSFKPPADKLKGLNILVESARVQMAKILQGGTINANGFWEKSQNLKPFALITEDEKYLQGFSSFINELSGASGSANDVMGQWNRQTGDLVKAVGVDLRNDLARLALADSYKLPRFYIPTLRTLRKIASDGQDIYQTRIHEDHFKEGKSPPNTFTGLSLFKQYKEMLLGTAEQRAWIADFEQFISKTFYPGRKVTLIPRENTGSLEVQIGNEDQRPISELGDGVQAIILLTFPLFQQRESPAIFLYDEPEAFLHPGFQRVFLTTLRDRATFPHHQYFITTHSNHLLDMTADKESVSIFTFRQDTAKMDPTKPKVESAFRIENVANDDMQPLALLGVRNSSVLLSNCTVWIEGITDRRYLARWLKLHSDETGKKLYREDLHFSFVEYSGGNITHWSFLDNEDDAVKPERLCAKLFLIADKDNVKPESEKAKRAEKLRKTLGDHFYQLPCREIENLLTPETVSAIVKDIEGKEVSFTGIELKEWESIGMGTLIQDRVASSGIQSKRKYASDSGTVARKVEFCANALGHINQFSDLSPAAKELTAKVYEFIEKKNS